MIRAKILKKYPKAYDFETNLSKFAIIIFTILFLIIIGTQVFFGSLGEISTKLFSEPVKKGILYQDKSGKFSFKVSPEFKLETTDFGGIIYKEDHRKLKENDPQKYGEVPNLQISFELIDSLPKSLPGGPDINLTREKYGDNVYFIGEVMPSQMPNKHYFVMLPVGYLDLRVDPIFNSINDDERLWEISNQLEHEIGEIIKNLKIPAKK